MDEGGFYAILFLALVGLCYLWIGLERETTFSFLRAHRRSEKPIAFWFDIAVHAIATALLVFGVVAVGLGFI
jgi:hypothetical protein